MEPKIKFSDDFIKYVQSLSSNTTSNKGVNINSNKTVGENAKKAGRNAVRQKNRRKAENISRFNRQNEMHTARPMGEISGETVYDTERSPKVIGVSGTDPIAEFHVMGKALSPISSIVRWGRDLYKKARVAYEINKAVDEGLMGATKEVPVVNPFDLYNPDHFRKIQPKSPKLLEVERTPASVEAVENGLDDGLHVYPLNEGFNSVDLIKGSYGHKLKYPLDPFIKSLKFKPLEPVQEPARRQINKLSVHPQDAGLVDEGPHGDIDLLSNLSKKENLDKFVDSDGNVNMRALVPVIKNWYKNHPNAANYKNIYNSSGNLLHHIGGVVKSAQQIPVPEGYTRQLLVLSALFHDIGKVFERSKHGHGPMAVQILKDAGYELDPAVENAISHHMSNHMLDKDNLTRALHFADVARGDSWDKASFLYPHLSYPFLKKPLNIQKLPIRDELKTRINPWLKNKGYETIPLDVSEEEAWRLLDDRINRHLSFLRGVRDPVKEVFSNPDDERNASNAVSSLMLNYGLGFDFASSVDAAPIRMRDAAQRVPMSPTAPGRRSMLYADTRKNGLTEYKQNEISKDIGANPETTDALYVSTSDKVADQYATANTDNRDGAAYIVQFPKTPRVPGESMSEHLLKNDFEMISADAIHDGQNRGFGAMYEDPYRLLTGRSLLSDMLKAGLIKPTFKKISSDIIHPGERYLGNSYMRYGWALQDANKALKDLGIRFQFSTVSGDGIALPKKIKNASSVITTLRDAYKSLQKSYLVEMKKTHSGVSYLDHPMPTSLVGWNANTYMPRESVPDEYYESLINGLPDENVLAELGEQYNKQLNKRKFLNLLDFPEVAMGRLRADGLITDKLFHAVKKAFIHGGNPLKYVNFKKLANKEVDKYLNALRGKKLKKYKPDFSSIKLDPEQMAQFMRERGAVPAYEIEGYGNKRMFVLDANKKNITKNKGDIKRTYGYVLGKKGEKIFDIREEVPVTKRKNPKHVNKDSGEYSKHKISRKTLKNIAIPVISAVAASKTNKEK